MLRQVLGASVGFRVGSLTCLRDVVVKFEKGAIESVSADEINFGVCFLSGYPKMQVLICDLEVVMRSKSQESRTSGRENWMVVANIASFLSVSIANMVVKTAKAIVEVEELKLDISKDRGTEPNQYVKLHLQPILVHLCESRTIPDQSSCSDFQASSSSSNRSSAALFCEELSLSSQFGHDRTVGMVMGNMEIVSGDVILKFDEYSFSESKQSSASVQDEPHKDQQLLETLAKYSTSFPEKISFSLRKLELICVNRERDLLAENSITGIQLNSVKSKYVEETGEESTRLDVELELNEINVYI